MKKYTVSYASAPTGYGWQHEYDTLEEFEDFIDELRHHRGAHLTVWDDELQKFIFWKRPLDEPHIDMLAAADRDMRTSTRKRKG